AAPRRRDRARPRSAVGGAAPAVARLVAAGVLFGQSLPGYISSEPARLNGNTFTAVSLPSAAARGAQTMRRVQRVSPLPNRAFDKSQLRQPDFRSNDSAPSR